MNDELNNNVINEQTSESGNNTGEQNSYIEAIKEMRKNSVAKADYERLQAENKELMKALVNGETIDIKPPKVVDVTAKLVKRQRYAVGYKQAQAFQVAELQAGKQPTKLRDIMQGRANWDFIKEKYHEIRSQGYSAKAASATIGEMFYIEA